jgi:hypothetical protein
LSTRQMFDSSEFIMIEEDSASEYQARSAGAAKAMPKRGRND